MPLVPSVRAVLNETLRLFPPVPMNERATNHPVAVPTSQGRFYISGPNTQILYLPVLMQRRTDLWGPDAENFDPERWLDERNRAFVADPMRFVPFDAGPRIVSCSFLRKWPDLIGCGVVVLGTTICAEPGVVCGYEAGAAV